MTTLREIHCAAVDHATMISYWKKDPQDKSSGKSALLLDMVAGARDVPDESEEDASDDVAEARTADGTGRISFNEDDIPIFNDNIMDCLHQETNDLLNDLQKISVRCEGRRRCPLCPFRSFTQLRLLRTHVTTHHTSRNQYVCSGTKTSQDHNGFARARSFLTKYVCQYVTRECYDSQKYSPAIFAVYAEQHR